MENAENFRCNFCVYTSATFRKFKNHYVRYHRNDPNFSVTCCIDSCAYTTKKWGSYKVHVHRKHKEYDEPLAVNYNDPGLDEDVDHGDVEEGLYGPCGELVNEQFDQYHSNALFTLSLAAKQHLGDVAIDSITDSFSEVVSAHLRAFKDGVKNKLHERGIGPNLINEVLEEVLVDNSIENVSTSAKRNEYYTQNFPYVQPEEVTICHEYQTKNGQLEAVSRKGYFVPLTKNIHNLLNMPEVLYFVDNSHQSGNEFMGDIGDGDFVKNHALFQEHPDALQIILNCDDLEVVNPIGTHTKKHKITAFYLTIANIPPQFRSKVTAIQLVALAKTKHVRQDGGLEKLLKDFIDTVNRLSSADGIKMNINGNERTIRGSLVLVAADTLAAQWLGGFKEGVGFAFKLCRGCDCSRDTLKTGFTAAQFNERNDEIHRERCLQLGAMSQRARKHWSKIWGINVPSCLLRIKGFSLEALVQDPMHILLEGVVKRELELFLQHFICVDKHFTLAWLNGHLKTYPFSYLHKKNRPERIEKDRLGNIHIRLTAAAILMLCNTLPCVIGHKIERGNAYWINFLRLIQIVILCTSSNSTRETASLLRILIATFLRENRGLYPRESFIPKMHYMLHLPKQLLLFGPLRNQWCMRFEAKNGYFKNRKYKSFRNLPLTMAKQHQTYMCYHQSSSRGERSRTYLYGGDVVNDGEEVQFLEQFPNLHGELNNLRGANLVQDMTVFRTSGVTIHGLHYERNQCAVVLAYEEDDTPKFAYVRDIVVHNLDKYFVLETSNHIQFNTHIASYIIEPSNEFHIKRFYDLKFKWPLSVYTYDDRDAILNSHSHTCGML